MLVLCGTPARASGDAAKSAGDVLQFALPATAAALTVGFHDGEGARQMAWSTALTLGTTLTLKAVVNERRPNGDPHSFPSGHASISFESAEFMRRRYGWAFGVPAYALATFVGYSRVESREHYMHDVVAGTVIGVGSSLIFTRPYHGWHASVRGDASAFDVVFSRCW
jgi:membrane-associated phospholipid phosphatase